MKTWIALGALLLQAAPVVASQAADFLGIADRRDMVVDQVNNIMYVSTSTGRIERYDISTGTRLAAWSVAGTSFNGLDISRDGSRLFVADGTTTGAVGTVQIFDTRSGERTASTYQLNQSEREPWDIAVTSAGYALVTSELSGSGWLPFRTFDTQTGAGFELGSTVRQRTQLYSSADGNFVLFAEGNISPSSLRMWDAANQEFISWASRPDYNSFKGIAVSRNGDYVAVSHFGIEVLDRQLQPVTTLAGFRGGVGFSPIADILFVGDHVTNEIVAFDMATFSEIERYSVPDTLLIAVPFGSGIMDFSQDGRTLMVTTYNGIARIDNVVPSPGPVLVLGACGLLCRRRRR